jgi:hypothetical protein
MLESLNEFFTATYTYNEAFYGIQLLAVMSLAGISLGLASQLITKGWRSVRHRLLSKKG